METYNIDKCYLITKKNKTKHIVYYHLSDFYLSLEEAYNIISPILRIDFSLIDDLNELIEIICVKLVVETSGQIQSFEELKKYSIKEVESSLIPF